MIEAAWSVRQRPNHETPLAPSRTATILGIQRSRKKLGLDSRRIAEERRKLKAGRGLFRVVLENRQTVTGEFPERFGFLRLDFHEASGGSDGVFEDIEKTRGQDDYKRKLLL